MMSMKQLPPLLAGAAVIALTASQVFAQGASVANTTPPYTATAAPNCCVYQPPAFRARTSRA